MTRQAGTPTTTSKPFWRLVFKEHGFPDRYVSRERRSDGKHRWTDDVRNAMIYTDAERRLRYFIPEAQGFQWEEVVEWG